MVKHFITAIFFIVMAIVIMVNFMGCSDMFENPYPWPGDLEIEEEPKYDLDNDVVTNQDKSPGELEKENINSIWRNFKRETN